MGVPINTSIHLVEKMQIIDKTKVKIIPAISAVDTSFFNSSYLPDPNIWAMRTEVPMHIPKIKNIATDMMEFATPTAANAFFPMNLPTIMASVVL